jgi:hypothetical protein
MPLARIEHRGWTIDIPQPGSRYTARIWRPGASTSEPFHELAQTRAEIIDLAKLYIDRALAN